MERNPWTIRCKPTYRKESISCKPGEIVRVHDEANSGTSEVGFKTIWQFSTRGELFWVLYRDIQIYFETLQSMTMTS